MSVGAGAASSRRGPQPGRSWDRSAGAAALKPRHRVEYLGQRKLAGIVPTSFGQWTERPSSAFVLPKTPGSLADRLYNDTLTRLYTAPGGAAVMMVLAYGSVQSDVLQLHRPEVCYRAVGFDISHSAKTRLPLGAGLALPVRELAATSESRSEPIVYWTRIGDELPTDGAEQRRMKLAEQFRGIIPDGILVRLSMLGTPSDAAYAELLDFGRALVLAVKPADRTVLIGPTLARALAGR